MESRPRAHCSFLTTGLTIRVGAVATFVAGAIAADAHDGDDTGILIAIEQEA